MSTVRKKGKCYYLRFVEYEGGVLVRREQAINRLAWELLTDKERAALEGAIRIRTRKGAEEVQRKFENRRAIGQDITIAQKNETLGVVFKEFERVESPNMKDATWHGYESAFNRHWVPQFDEMPIRRVDVKLIEGVLQELEGELEASTRALLLFKLSGFMVWAKKRGYVARNPCSDVTTPRDFRVSRPPAISFHWAELLLENVEPRYRPHISVLYFAGLRIGELRALHLRDFHGPTLRVDKTVYRSGKDAMDRTGQPTQQPKTPEAMRTVHLPMVLNDLLRRWESEGRQRSCPDPSSSRFLFPGPDGGPIREGVLREALAEALESLRADMEDEKGMLDQLHESLPETLTPHGLRAGYARLMLESGMPLHELRHQMGHSKIQTTLGYARHNGDADRPVSLNTGFYAFTGYLPSGSVGSPKAAVVGKNRGIPKKERVYTSSSEWEKHKEE